MRRIREVVRRHGTSYGRCPEIRVLNDSCHSTVSLKLKHVLCNNGMCVLKCPLATWMYIIAQMLPSVLGCSLKPQADGQEVKTLASSLSVPSLVEAFRC
jgi:hypothetical protein